MSDQSLDSTSQPPIIDKPVAPVKKKIVLKRAAGTANANHVLRIKVDKIENESIKNVVSLATDQHATIECAKYLTLFKKDTAESSPTTTDIDIKRVIEITLDTNSSTISYQPGDYIQIFAPNPHNLVLKVLNRLGLDKNQFISIESLDLLKYELPNNLKRSNNQKLYYIFRDMLDITGIPSKKLLKLLSEYSSDQNEKNELLKLSSVEGKEEYSKLISTRSNLISLLDKYKSSQPPLDYLLDILPPLSPRDYSISSSPLVIENGKLNFVFSVVDMIIGNERIRGHCTSWLESICLNTNKIKRQDNNSDDDFLLEIGLDSLCLDNNEKPVIPIMFKSSPHFHLPEDLDKPIIMIGPGTGVAPFIGFLQHISKQLKFNPYTWLFFGCRSEKRDFLYKDTILDMVESKTLKKLTTAFSREINTTSTIDLSLDITCGYVQEKMKNHSKEIFDLVYNQNALIYICGDAKGMAIGVRNSFIDIFQNELSISEKDATDIFTQLIKDKRYLLDVWS
ncbi:hypothetical protein CYY_006837 [Polysphondylium violaceum]|uniref:FAD-binding FR-type domain-containing protein n=1 Tax=Polysphondylium violaceum TaxID=133409 RepID=A0A8J4PPH9_9MYCE|nr:hypothetical protein CYY_006837 [Polysphondylium violaceum]